VHFGGDGKNRTLFFFKIPMNFRNMNYDRSSTESILKNLNWNCDTIISQYMEFSQFGLHTNEEGTYNLFSIPREDTEVNQQSETMFVVKKSEIRTAVTGMY